METYKPMTWNELQKRVKELNIRQPKGCKKDDLIKLLKEIFINEPNKRKEIKELFDSLNLKFNNNDFEPRKVKKIKTEVNLQNLYDLEYLKEKFIKEPSKRNKWNNFLKFHNLRFDKNSNDFKPIKEKKIKTEANIKNVFIPDYEIVEVNEKFIKKFKTYQKTYKIKEINQLRPEQYHNILKDLFRKAIGRIQGKVDIITFNPELSQPFHPKMMSAQEAYNEYLDVLTHKIEYKELDIKDCLFVFNVIELPNGGRHKAKKILNDKDIINKKSIIQIKNDDDICLARSIITALSIQNSDLLCEKLNLEKLTKYDIRYIKEGRKLQKTLATKLHEMCNIPLQICDLSHVKQFEEFLNIQITIFCRENFNERIYNGNYKPTCIYIYKNRNHFDVITSVTGFLGKNNYCDYCKVSYKRKNEHKCLLKCDRCFRLESNCDGESIMCNECFRCFKGKKCFENHKNKLEEFSVCEILWKCLKCNRNINRIKRKVEEHECGEKECKNCRQWVKNDHKCYMKSRKSLGGICEKVCKECENCKFARYGICEKIVE